MKMLKVSTTKVDLSDTPFLPGREAVAVNLDGTNDAKVTDGDGNALVTVSKGTIAAIDSLPASIKSDHDVYLLGGV